MSYELPVSHWEVDERPCGGWDYIFEWHSSMAVRPLPIVSATHTLR